MYRFCRFNEEFCRSLSWFFETFFVFICSLPVSNRSNAFLFLFFSAASSRMRRSETWSSPFQKSIPLLPSSPTSDVTTALSDVRSTSGVISFTASSGSDNSIYPGSNFLSFRKSLSDIFNPEKTTISDPRDRSSSTGSSGVLFDPDLDLDTPLSPDPFSRPRFHSLPTLPSESFGDHLTTPGTEPPSPASPKPKPPPVRHESTALPAVAEADSSSELQEMNSVGINHDTDSPGEMTYSTRRNRILTRSMSYGGDTKAAVSGALTQPEEVRVPEVRPRRLGILELFERKTVRNKDVNAMAPQSW